MEDRRGLSHPFGAPSYTRGPGPGRGEGGVEADKGGGRRGSLRGRAGPGRDGAAPPPPPTAPPGQPGGGPRRGRGQPARPGPAPTAPPATATLPTPARLHDGAVGGSAPAAGMEAAGRRGPAWGVLLPTFLLLLLLAGQRGRAGAWGSGCQRGREGGEGRRWPPRRQPLRGAGPGGFRQRRGLCRLAGDGTGSRSRRRLCGASRRSSVGQREPGARLNPRPPRGRGAGRCPDPAPPRGRGEGTPGYRWARWASRSRG